MEQKENKLELIIPNNTDYFLTGNPEISFFICVYRRYTHFSTQLININFDTPVNFNSISEIKIPSYGDLLHNFYLKFIIPEVSINKNIEQSIIDEYNKKINDYNNLYKLFKQLVNYNMSSYVNILNLKNLNNLSIDILYQIVNSNTSSFEYNTVNEKEKYGNYTYLDFNIEFQKEEYQDIISSDIKYSNEYTYGNYQTSLTMNKENIKSLLTKNKQEENVDNIIIILNSIKSTMEKLNKKFIQIINDTENEKKEKTSNYNFAWVKYLGHNLIDYIEFKIGNDVIDKQYGQWINIWWELTGDKNKDNLYSDLIGNKNELTDYNDDIKYETNIYVPIPFWFSRHIGLSLPLIALQYSDITVRLKLRNFREVCYSDYDVDNLNDLNKNLSCSLLCEYIFLDKMERDKFARASHEYLIEQTQYNYEDIILNDKNMHQFNFHHPVKGIVWFLQPKINYNDNNIIPNTTIYENNIINCEIILENETLEIGNHFNSSMAYFKFNNSGIDGIYSYWFSIFPYEYQPSGSCNMSFIKNKKLLFNVDNSLVGENYILNIYCLNYNILRISNGSGYLAFK